ncbi:FAD:protein FMN transferase [Lentilactobacillus sp. Marseille-Q4993]|uniref:FAD:protein FMN transferase n=1 Tax=Lentilactobacillus sp. Marseille-Q4993 TaxID=3039492 RepID=UPI0024BC4C1D|nr:FAD:protein FMN transferase [Lentilactobacillus sp. Marseille-Q4993]
MQTKTFKALGTRIDLQIDDDAPADLLNESEQLVNQFEDALTVNRDQSEIMAVNHAADIQPVVVSDSSFRLVKRAVEVSRLNLGFNVAIGPLVKLWSIGFKDARIPTEAEIKQASELIDINNVILNETDKSVFLTKSGMELDLGGIAKGYIADGIKKLWETQGVTSGIINLGGNVLLVGTGPHGGNWNVGIREPVETDQPNLAVISTSAKSLVTSGIFERYLEVDGKMYHHIIDPRTGHPLETELASVTAITPVSTKAEIWSSLAFFNGIIKAPQLVSQLKADVDLIFVTRDNRVFITSRIEDKFQIIDDNYKLAGILKNQQ